MFPFVKGIFHHLKGFYSLNGVFSARWYSGVLWLPLKMCIDWRWLEIPCPMWVTALRQDQSSWLKSLVHFLSTDRLKFILCSWWKPCSSLPTICCIAFVFCGSYCKLILAWGDWREKKSLGSIHLHPAFAACGTNLEWSMAQRHCSAACSLWQIGAIPIFL